MSYGLDTEIKQLALSNNPLSPAEVKQASQAITADMSNFRALADGVNELETNENPTPAQKVRLGICYYLLGRNRLATSTLSTADGSALALFYLGKAKFAQGDYRGAEDAYQQASKAGFPGDDCTLARVDALRNAGDAKSALQMLDGLSGAVEQTAEYLYQRGATVGGSRRQPARSRRPARASRRSRSRPSRRALRPGDGKRSSRQRRCRDGPLPEVGRRAFRRTSARCSTSASCIEDRQQFERARQCYQRILDAYPNDPRARLFLKDAQASTDMVYDENEKIKAATA